MSSLRNSLKRRAHKERAQPAERKRYGLLEKHKDYVLRARDFHRKEKAIKELQVKASFRNPDEFYFKMEHARTSKGVHLPAPRKQLSEEELALLRTQDRGYILTKLQAERKKVERLKASLHRVEGLTAAHETSGTTEEGLACARQNSHAVFVDDDEEPRDVGPSASVRTGPAGNPADDQDPAGAAVRLRKGRGAAAAYRELEQREARVRQLSAVLEEMNRQKAIMGKGRKVKLQIKSEDGQETTTVYKWANRRQK